MTKLRKVSHRADADPPDPLGPDDLPRGPNDNPRLPSTAESQARLQQAIDDLAKTQDLDKEFTKLDDKLDDLHEPESDREPAHVGARDHTPDIHNHQDPPDHSPPDHSGGAREGEARVEGAREDGSQTGAPAESTGGQHDQDPRAGSTADPANDGSQSPDHQDQPPREEPSDPAVALEKADPARYHALGLDAATGKFRPQEAATAARIEVDRGVQLQRYPSGHGPDWTGSDGKSYDAVGNFPAQYFDRQWTNLQQRITDHLIRQITFR